VIPKKYLAAVVAGLSIAVGAFLASDPFSRERGSAWSSTRLQAPATTEPAPTRGKVMRPRFAALRCAVCL
jgi:hypothetical protein